MGVTDQLLHQRTNPKCYAAWRAELAGQLHRIPLNAEAAAAAAERGGGGGGGVAPAYAQCTVLPVEDLQ